MKNFEDYGIEIQTNKTVGEWKTTCPQCSHTRKKKTDKCLSVNLGKRVWRCNHCPWAGGLPPIEGNKIEYKIEYKKPEWKNKTDLSEKLVKWFEARGISQNTLKNMKISEGIEWMPKFEKEVNTIQFNYFYLNELINIKYRDGKKGFKLAKDAEKIFYNIDSIIGSESVYIVEGEMDVLSFVECGIKNCISVPNGAKSSLDECLNNYIDLFEEKEIIIAVDNDKDGRELENKLKERFGVENCKFIDWKDCKDANEFLIKYKSIEFLNNVKDKKEYPLSGVFSLNDLSNEISDLYYNGLDRGINLGIDGFELNIVKGYLTIITGIPSHGKSDWLDYMILQATIKHNWKGALYSPENRPLKLHFSKMARKIIGKPWDDSPYGKRMSFNEVKQVEQFLNNKIFFIKPENDFTLDNILNSARQIQKRNGLDYIVIDAWNKLNHAEIDTDSIGKTLDKLTHFLEVNKVHCFLVAHPTKMGIDVNNDNKVRVPNLYDIKGSSTFYDKADNGITVYRDFKKEESHIYVNKVKFDHWGQVNTTPAVFKYHIDSKRYYKKDTNVNLDSWIPKENQKEINFNPKNAEINESDFLEHDPNNPFFD
jgi:twinkle protein